MKEREVLEKLATKHCTTLKAAKEWLDDYHAILKEAMKNGDEVIISDMGKYAVQTKPARDARNPMTGETVKVPAKTVAKWKPNKKFKDDVLSAPIN